MSEQREEVPFIISTYLHQGRKQFFAYSRAEAFRAAYMWERILRVSGLVRGDMAVVISAPEDAHALIPLEETLERAGIIMLQADSTVFEGLRIEAFIRNFNPAALFGVCRATLDGLTMLAHDPETLFKDRMVWARDDALEAVQRFEGVKLRRWASLGPAMLMGCGHHPTAAHLDGIEWELAIDGGQAKLSHRVAAATPGPVMLEMPGIQKLTEPCRCGIGDPLVELPVAG